jgi:hypothetical protein
LTLTENPEDVEARAVVIGIVDADQPLTAPVPA